LQYKNKNNHIFNTTRRLIKKNNHIFNKEECYWKNAGEFFYANDGSIEQQWSQSQRGELKNERKATYFTTKCEKGDDEVKDGELKKWKRGRSTKREREANFITPHTLYFLCHLNILTDIVNTIV